MRWRPERGWGLLLLRLVATLGAGALLLVGALDASGVHLPKADGSQDKVVPVEHHPERRAEIVRAIEVARDVAGLSPHTAETGEDTDRLEDNGRGRAAERASAGATTIATDAMRTIGRTGPTATTTATGERATTIDAPATTTSSLTRAPTTTRVIAPRPPRALSVPVAHWNAG